MVTLLVYTHGATYTTYVLTRMNYGWIIAIELQIVAKTIIIKLRFNGLDISNYKQKIKLQLLRVSLTI